MLDGQLIQETGKALRLCVCVFVIRCYGDRVRSVSGALRESRGQHSRIYIQTAANGQHKGESLQKYTSTVMTPPLRADQKNTC